MRPSGGTLHTAVEAIRRYNASDWRSSCPHDEPSGLLDPRTIRGKFCLLRTDSVCSECLGGPAGDTFAHRGHLVPVLRPARTVPLDAFGSLRRSVRFDVAVCLAIGCYVFGPGGISSPAFGWRLRHTAVGCMDCASRFRGTPRAPDDATGARTIIRSARYAQYLGISGFRSFFRFEPRVSSSGPRAAFPTTWRRLLAVSGARRARPHGQEQCLRGTAGACGRSCTGPNFRAPAHGPIHVG